MTTNTLKAAPAASAKELKNEKPAKAKRMLVGVDTHLRGYQAARKIDSGVIGVVENFRSEEELRLYVAKQTTRAEQVVVVYEAGPLGYPCIESSRLQECFATSVRLIAVSSAKSVARTTKSMPAA